MGAEQFSPSGPGAPAALGAGPARSEAPGWTQRVVAIACVAVLAASGVAAVALSAPHRGGRTLRPASHQGPGLTLVRPPRTGCAAAPVLGVVLGGAAEAWSYPQLARQQVLDATLGGRPLVVVFRPAGTHSGGEVFESVVHGKMLFFRAKSNGMVDVETGSSWNLSGVATAGPLAGSRLAPVAHLTTSWADWTAQHPHTSVWPGPPAGCARPSPAASR